MKYCSQCGAQMSDTAAFCASCGTRNEVMQEQGANNAQGFTPPPAAPAFTTPQAAPAQKMQAFSAVQQDAPTFTPPQQDIPTFTPPQQDIPTFTPPQDAVPIFTPPKQEQIGNLVCHFHPAEPAVAKCSRCGKYICQDCAEAYGVVDGQYAGQTLCYDCTAQMVEENVVELKKNKTSIMITFILTLVGMLFGAIMGASFSASAPGVIIGMAIGGCLWTFTKCFFRRAANGVKGAYDGSLMSIGIGIVVGCIVGFVIEAVVSIYRTIRKIIECIYYLKRTTGFIESDSNALQQMRDYMEYTQVMSQNKGVDLSSLMNEGSQLYNNSYAWSVAQNGEAAADAHLRQCVTTIAENGEIIRSFAA